jgi:phage repressor protein C with HTH and peptisase S24 domain
MRAAGVSTTQLARELDISYQAVKKVLSGGSGAFNAENNAAAARFLGVSSDWLATGKGERAAAPVASEPPADYGSDLTIPQYAAGGAMGRGLVLEEKQPGLIKSWRVDHEWLRLNVRHHTGVQNLCIVTGFGPSMQPKYNPGDPLLLDRGVNSVESEGIYFFRVGQHGFIKQLQRIPTEAGMVIRAKSLNPSYDSFDITAKMDFEVFGKVLTVWKSEQV